MIEGLKYIGGPTGGIPERIFDLSTPRGRIEGVSKKELYYEISPVHLTLGVVGESSPPRFQAWVDDEILYLNIQNKGENNQGQRHPDIYATKLAKRFVQHVKENGQNIKKFSDGWMFFSDNYKQFNAYLNTLEAVCPTTSDDAKVAALSTVSGKLATSLGYDKVELRGDWRSEMKVSVDFMPSNR